MPQPTAEVKAAAYITEALRGDYLDGDHIKNIALIIKGLQDDCRVQDAVSGAVYVIAGYVKGQRT